MRNPIVAAMPNDEKLRTFAVMADFLERNPIFRRLALAIHYALFAISPAVPCTFSDLVRDKPTRRGLWWGAGLTFFFCFVVPAFWSILTGTFSGTDQRRIYFSRDWTDLINFSIVCPAYVGLSVLLIVLVLGCYSRLVNPSGLVAVSPLKLPIGSMGASAFIVLSFSALVTVQYIMESLNPKVYSKVGWWVGSVTVEGIRTLGPLGLYYVVIIFALAVICMTAALTFLALFFLCVRFGRLVRDQPVTTEIDFDAIKDLLSVFTQAYVVMKLLAVVLVINVYTWRMRNPEGSLTFNSMNTAILIVGVFFISLPRYYIELEWFRFRVRRAIALGDKDSLERDDIRPFQVRVVSWIADGLILSSFCSGYFHLNF